MFFFSVLLCSFSKFNALTTDDLLYRLLLKYWHIILILCFNSSFFYSFQDFAILFRWIETGKNINCFLMISVMIFVERTKTANLIFNSYLVDSLLMWSLNNLRFQNLTWKVLFAARLRPRGFLLGRVFSRPLCGNTDDFKRMYLCHKGSVQ